MLRLPLVAASILTLAAAMASPPPAAAADLVTAYRSYGGACAYPGVLSRIESKFRYQVTHVPHLRDVDILEFHSIRERRYLPKTERWPIERLYCSATATLSDGSHRSVWYLIEYGMGFASIGDKVEFCVSGFDRWHVYDGSCRVLR